MGAVWAFIGDLFGISSDHYTVESRTYRDSNFRAIYKKTHKQQTIQSVVEGLKKLKNKEFAHIFQKLSINESHQDDKENDNENDKKYATINSLSAGAVAVKCWSLQTPKFYGALKRVLITDNKAELAKWMPFIRALNSKLVCQNNPAKRTCYRGSKMSLQDFAIYKYGYIYRIPYYIATSIDEQVAKSWPNSNYLIQFNVPKHCPNAAFIGELSVFPNEKEVLLPPYTAVRVVGKSATSMIVEVLDNLTAPKDTAANIMKVDNKQIQKMGSGTVLNYGGLAGTGAVAAGFGGVGVAIGAAGFGAVGAVVTGSIGGMAVMSNGVVASTTDIQSVQENKFVD